jgi:hypothetical protein
MWSGPRNISTALLRSWGNRPDTWVCDEPFYAHYLLRTNLPHPGAAEVIREHESDWREVVAFLTGPIPAGRQVFYQKHMAHHLLPEIGRAWLDGLTNCFLIREPAGMLASLLKIYPEAGLEDTGLPQQWELFQRERERTGKVPPVLDAGDLLAQPEALLRHFCDLVEVPFREEMLQWAPGPRTTDGVWGKYWYSQVYRTTEFEPALPGADDRGRAVRPSVPSDLLSRCTDLYGLLHQSRITAGAR